MSFDLDCLIIALDLGGGAESKKAVYDKVNECNQSGRHQPSRGATRNGFEPVGKVHEDKANHGNRLGGRGNRSSSLRALSGCVPRGPWT